MLSFINWVRSYIIIGVSDKDKKVLDEIAKDLDFPETVCRWTILDYLDNCKTGKSKIDIIDKYYHEYIKHISQAVSPE